MNRGYTRERYLELIKEFRRVVPEGRLSTDIIVGFPTEAEKDFLETFDMMKRTGFDSAYIFKYSPRPNTEAARLPDDVPETEKKRRHKVLLDFQKGLARVRSASLLLGLFVMTLALTPEAWAMLDIFDHPGGIEKKVKAPRAIEGETKLLDYPKECMLKGDYGAAFEACRRLSQYPAARRFKGDVSYIMGLSALKLGRFPEARSYFNDVALLEGQPETLKEDASIGIADAYFLEGSPDKAEIAYKEVLAKYPDTAMAAAIYYRMAQALINTGRPEEAENYLSRINNESPLSFEARLSGNLKGAQAAAAAPAEASAGICYDVQAGCFNNKSNAQRLCAKLTKKGFDARILESRDPAKPRFIVKAGNFTSIQEAKAAQARLKKAGYSTKICP